MADKKAYDQTYFDTLYGELPEQTRIDKSRDALIVDIIRKHGMHKRVLEIGCGFGFLLHKIHTLGNTEIYGTDISPQAVEFARKLNSTGNLKSESILDGISFNTTFNSVIAVNVIEHLEDPAKAIKSIYEKMSNGGIFVAHLPLISNSFNKFVYSFTYAKDKTHVYKPTGPEFIQLCEKIGFELVDDLYAPFWPKSVCRVLKPHPAFMGVFRKKS